MFPMRSRYRELGLKLVYLGEDHSRHPKRTPMEEEKRGNGEGDTIKLLRKESLVRQRNEIVKHFAQILRQKAIATEG